MCPECGKLSPEISNININNKQIEFKCKICGINNYYSKYFYKEINKNNNIINYYINENKIWFKEYTNQKDMDYKNELSYLI